MLTKVWEINDLLASSLVSSFQKDSSLREETFVIPNTKKISVTKELN